MDWVRQKGYCTILVLCAFLVPAAAVEDVRKTQSVGPAERPAGIDVRTPYLSVWVTPEGLFTLGAEKMSLENESLERMDMTFGHPNNVSIDAVGSSYSTFRINGLSHEFHKSGTTVDLRAIGNSLAVTKKIDSLIVRQTISIVESTETGVSNSFHVSYWVSNTAATAKNLDIRLLLDTWSGYNDGVPFRIPVYGSDHLPTGKQIVKYETEIVPEELGYWETYETETMRPSVTCVGRLIPDVGPRPDRVMLVNWQIALDSPFMIKLQFMRPIGKDSAIAIYWLKHKIKPGETRTFQLPYGIRTYDLEGLNYPKVVDVDNNPFFITLTKINLTPKNRRYLLWVEDLPQGVRLLLPKEQPVPFLIPEQQEGSAMLSLRVLPDAPAEFDLTLVLKEGEEEKRYVCHVVNKLRDAPIEVDSYVTRDKNIHTRFHDVKGIMAEDYYLVAMLYDRQDHLVEKILLYNDGEHNDDAANDRVYANNFKSNLPVGEYRVQVILVHPNP